jgi:acylpyruvate hydrolase
MKLVSFRAPGGEQQYGEVRDGRVVAFDDGSTVKDRLVSGDRSPAGGPDAALDDVELLAPHVPRAIFGIGLNYLAHAQEQNAELPERPIVFMKLPTSVADPGAPVHAPAVVKRLDYEGELAVVIGPGGEGASPAVVKNPTARDT